VRLVGVADGRWERGWGLRTASPVQSGRVQSWMVKSAVVVATHVAAMARKDFMVAGLRRGGWRYGSQVTGDGLLSSDAGWGVDTYVIYIRRRSQKV